jgi:hypothetical protein
MSLPAPKAKLDPQKIWMTKTFPVSQKLVKTKNINHNEPKVRDHRAQGKIPAFFSRPDAAVPYCGKQIPILNCG